MSALKISTDLSVAGFDNALKELQKVKTKVEDINTRFIKESLDYLESRAVLHLSMTTGHGGYPLTDEIINSFKQDITEHIGILRNNAHYAAALEFGTGIVGKMAPHELANELGIVYDANSHGEKGWVYKGNDGNFYHTTGMEPHRYMYNALMDYLYQGGKEECMNKAMKELG